VARAFTRDFSSWRTVSFPIKEIFTLESRECEKKIGGTNETIAGNWTIKEVPICSPSGGSTIFP